jgi:DNA-binding transcriptional LysR family regulator
VPRLFTVLQQARDSVRGAANGFHGQQRITLSDGITPSRLPTLLALSWQEEPDVELRLFEVSLSQQIKGLHGDLYDLAACRTLGLLPTGYAKIMPVEATEVRHVPLHRHRP